MCPPGDCGTIVRVEGDVDVCTEGPLKEALLRIMRTGHDSKSAAEHHGPSARIPYLSEWAGDMVRTEPRPPCSDHPVATQRVGGSDALNRPRLTGLL